jgi:hypothetical protein
VSDQDQCVRAFARSAPTKWRRLRLHHENVDVDSERYIGKLEQYVVYVILDGKKQDDHALNTMALNLLGEICIGIHKASPLTRSRHRR